MIITYKAKTIKDNRKVYGYLVVESSRVYKIYDGDIFHEVIPDSIRMFTGFKKNGKKVFVGDTLLGSYDTQYKVKFGEFEVGDIEREEKVTGFYLESNCNGDIYNISLEYNDIETMGLFSEY